MTPKQAAKSSRQFSKRFSKQDPQIQMTRFFVPQVPGAIKRSKPVHGLVDGVFHAKKYLCRWPFSSVRRCWSCNNLLFRRTFRPRARRRLWTPEGFLEQPLSRDEQRAWQRELQALVKSDPSLKLGIERAGWKPLEAPRNFTWTHKVHAVLQLTSGDTTKNPKTALAPRNRSNILASADSQQQARLLLVARLHEELRGGRTKKASDASSARTFLTPAIAHGRACSRSLLQRQLTLGF